MALDISDHGGNDRGRLLKSALPGAAPAGRTQPVQHVVRYRRARGRSHRRRHKPARAGRSSRASPPLALRFVRQEPQLGTGGTQCSRPCPKLHDEGTALILNGDVPLIEATLALLEACADAARAADVVARRPTGWPHRAQRRSGGRARSRRSSSTRTPTRLSARSAGLHRRHGRADGCYCGAGSPALKNDNAQKGVLPHRRGRDGP